MKTEPSYWDLDRFTNGNWITMSEAEQKVAFEQCSKEFEQRSKELEQRRLQLRWKRLCPPLYRDTSLERLPYVALFEEVQKWEYGPQGLLLIGGTRRGKTRSAWKLLERLHFAGRTILAFTPMDLKLRIGTAWRDGEADSWMYTLRNCDILFFDDLDTIKLTEAVEETIYDVFEHRPAHGRPIIATLNQTGEELAARMNTNGRGVKIVERFENTAMS